MSKKITCPLCNNSDLLLGEVYREGKMANSTLEVVGNEWEHDCYKCKECGVLFTVWGSEFNFDDGGGE